MTERVGQVVVRADGSHAIQEEPTNPGEIPVGEIVVEGLGDVRFLARPNRPLPQIDGGIEQAFPTTDEAAEHLVARYQRARRVGLWRG